MSEIFKDIEAVKYMESSFALACTLICGWLCIYFYTKVIRTCKRTKYLVDRFPGPKKHPIFGNAFQILVPNHELLGMLKTMSMNYGKTLRIWLCNQPNLLVGDNLAVEKILSSVHNINKSQQYDMFHPWLGTGLLTSAGKKWHSRRKLLTPTFHFKILEDFVEIFNEQSLIFVSVLNTECADTTKEFNLSSYITRCALDIICETAMGKQINAQLENDSEYVRSVDSYTEVLIQRILRPWLHPPLVWKFSWQGRWETKCLNILHTFTEKVITERKKDRKTMESQIHQFETTSNQEDGGIHLKKKRKAFLDLLLDVSDTNEPLSDLDIREEVDTFMFEGHDTTAASLGWTLFLLGKHPKVQQRVQMELDEIFGEESDRVVNMTDASRMKYLECCIKESLRIYPSVPIFSRTIQQDIDLGNGLIIPRGMNCFVSPYLLHRDPATFPDPEIFDPDRFLPENYVDRNPYAYIPFSAGPRNCIGQKFALLEIKVVLAQLLRNFRFEALDEEKDLKIVPDLIIRPKDGLRFRIFKRSSDYVPKG